MAKPSSAFLLTSKVLDAQKQTPLFFEDDPTQDVEARDASAVPPAPAPPKRDHARKPLPVPTPFHARIHPYEGKNIGLASRLPTWEAVEAYVKKVSRWLIKDETIFVEGPDGTILCLWYKEGKKWVRESHMPEAKAEVSDEQQETHSRFSG